MDTKRLIKAVRHCAKTVNHCENCPGRDECEKKLDNVCLLAAADLIENLTSEVRALSLANAALRDYRADLRWVPATEKLPTPFVSVLGYAPSDAPLPTVHECYIDNGGAWHGLAFYGNPKITHWMPMPVFEGAE